MREALGILDMLGAFMMAALFLKITPQWGIKTSQKRWGMLRRANYCVCAVGLFGLGLDRMEGLEGESIFQMMLLYYIMIFPVLRALGFISQDSWIASSSWDDSRRGGRAR